jgi:hypothetical protein
MAAGRLHGLELGVIDPLLDSGIGDPEPERSLPGCQKHSHATILYDIFQKTGADLF